MPGKAAERWLVCPHDLQHELASGLESRNVFLGVRFGRQDACQVIVYSQPIRARERGDVESERRPQLSESNEK